MNALARSRALSYFGVVADAPRFSGAVLRTLKELRLEGIEISSLAQAGAVAADLGLFLERYAKELAGVGHLTLVDDDLLTWPNVGRHPLGATAIGKKKSLALAATLQENYPHLTIEGFDGKLECIFATTLFSNPAGRPCC